MVWLMVVGLERGGGRMGRGHVGWVKECVYSGEIGYSLGCLWT